MMQLTSMRLSDEEAKEEYGATAQPSAENLPKYPYGLCIDLCDEAAGEAGHHADATGGQRDATHGHS